MFDQYVSLGFNCEVAFQMRRRLGDAPSGFFNWRVADVDAICRLIRRRFQAIMLDGCIGPGANVAMLRDELNGFEFHTTDDIAGERAKMTALGRRFLAPEGRRLYLLKPYDRDLTDSAMHQLAAALDGIDTDYRLVLLLNDRQNAPTLPDRFTVERLRFHAPDHQADQGDAEGYDRVFDRYPLHDAASYSPLKNKSTPLAAIVAPPDLARTRVDPAATA